MDISKQLHAYEVEYHVLQDEMVDAIPLSEESDRLDKLEKTNAQLKKQNMDLLEKLQVWLFLDSSECLSCSYQIYLGIWFLICNKS